MILMKGGCLEEVEWQRGKDDQGRQQGMLARLQNASLADVSQNGVQTGKLHAAGCWLSEPRLSAGRAAHM
jgi:hypothetical protein